MGAGVCGPGAGARHAARPGQDGGELGDVAREYGAAPGAASAVFHKLGCAMACGANIGSRPGPANTEIEPNANALSRRGTGELGGMAEQLGAALGTASATISGLGCGAGAPERGAPPKRGEEDAWCTDAGVAIGGRRGTRWTWRGLFRRRWREAGR